MSDLAERLRGGDRRALAQGITLVESTRPDHRAEATTLLQAVMADTGGAVRVGVTGPPGAGKSTFIESLGLLLTEAGHRVAVLAVDPTSRVSGGSILGDKTRMVELSKVESAFIRPSPSGRTAGGIARRTREALLLSEAAGFDVVVVETVGSGQSDVAVADLVDVFALLEPPAAGDDLQGIKRGVMELADVLVVAKADGDLRSAASRTAADLRQALTLLHPDDAPSVVTCSAHEGVGIDEVWAAIGRVRDDRAASGELERRRSRQAVAWMWSEVHEGLRERFDSRVSELAATLEARVAAGEVSPTTAARQLLDEAG